MALYRNINLEKLHIVDDWEVAEEPLSGSRAKQSLNPPGKQQQFVFKEPKLLREAQVYSELLGSYIAGDLLGWPVQHVSLAIKEGQMGTLMQYIFDPEKESFTEGVQFCAHIDPDYDEKKGHRHTWELLKRVYSEELSSIYSINEDSFYTYWARAISFDTLISNTDRHAENWAVVGDKDAYWMAPLYDNATSLGCEIDNRGLERFFDRTGKVQRSKFDRYADRGCHHLKISDPAIKGASFQELCSVFLKERPECLDIFQQVASLDLSPISLVLEEIKDLGGIPEHLRLNEKRMAHIREILHLGQERIKNVV